MLHLILFVILNIMDRRFLVTAILLFILGNNAKAQYFEEVTYKRWRIHMNNSFYRAASTKLEYGKYQIQTLPVRGFTVGFEYYFREGHDLQWFTGLNMHFIPLDNYEYQLPGIELGLQVPYYSDNTFRQIRERHNVFSIPIGFLYNIAQQGRFNYHAKAGINFDLIQYGEYGKRYSITNEQGISKQYLSVEMLSEDNNLVYPAIFLGAGVDYHTRWSKLHFTLNVQKGIIPYMKGAYHFYNLNESEDSYGSYKLWGDYIGLDIGITLKKFKK